MTQASASGESMPHSGLSCHAAYTNTIDATVTAATASVTRSMPLGISRCRVRGLRASMSRSTMRLKPIAAKRAPVKASTIQPIIGHVTGDRYDASTTPTSANGNANNVCGSFTKFA
jgi:hypothetical protein